MSGDISQMQQGEPVQIFKAEGETERYTLNENALRSILCKPELKGKSVAVYSVAGSFRKGKSFMLNLFMRYLRQNKSKEWLKNKDASLHDGFACKPGINRCTEGIWMWNRPFLLTDKDGKEVAVYLMDTQGTSDMKTGMAGNSVIFALSTLISSVQIFNLSKQVEAHDLQLLKLFTDYGKMAALKSDDDSENYKPFQSLLFLIRDWENEDYEDGMEGGKEYLKEVLRVQNDNIEELRVVRESIRESFNDVECFLMPPPGRKISKGGTKKGQTLKIREIDEEFLDCTNAFLQYLFSKKIVNKRVNGETITGNELLNLAIAYSDAFNSEDMPKVDTIYEACAKAAIQKTLEKAKEKYDEYVISKSTEHFQEECDLKKQHEEGKKEGLSVYDQQRKLGDKKFLEKTRRQLAEDLESKYAWLQQINKRDKAKAEKMWNTEKKKLAENYHKSIIKRWRPNDDQDIFANNCGKICREDIIEKFNERMEDYPKSFVNKCRNQLETSLDDVLKIVEEIFQIQKKKQIEILEEAKLKAKNLYITEMNRLFSLKIVRPEEINSAHKQWKFKVLNQFDSSKANVFDYLFTKMREELTFELDELIKKYLEHNKKNQEIENKRILETISKAIQLYKKLMEIDRESQLISEKELEEKHQASKKQAINQTYNKEGQEFYNKCYQKAETEIESQLSSIKNLQTLRKNELIRNFNQQVENLLQNYKQDIKQVEKSNLSKHDFTEIHKQARSRATNEFYRKCFEKILRKEFDQALIQLQDKIDKSWIEIQKDKEIKEKKDANLAIESAAMKCLDTINVFMNGRHIKPKALERLYKQAKVNRDIELKILGVTKGSPKWKECMQKFEEQYEEICKQNYKNKYIFLQINYDPFEDKTNTLCLIS